MRLGLNWLPLRSGKDLQAALPLIDRLGLGAIAAPADMREWTLDECAAYGELARGLGLVIGEVGYWQNLLTSDEALRARRIQEMRALLVRAEAMRVGCVVGLVGSFDEAALAPHRDNWGARARTLARENALRILDGLELQHTRYALEPWCNGFFHGPHAARSFLDEVGHPRLGLHLDQMNMHSVDTYFESSALINWTFDLLADRVISVHAKDLKWHPTHMFLRIDEVMPGEGVMDYGLFLRRLAGLDADLPVYVEHWKSAEQYEEAIGRVRILAEKSGVDVVRRG